MNEIVSGLTPTARLLLEAAVNSIWQSSLVALVVWGALRGHRRFNAATRFWMGWTALLAVAALPILHLLIVPGAVRDTPALVKPSAPSSAFVPPVVPGEATAGILSPPPEMNRVNVTPPPPPQEVPHLVITSVLPQMAQTPATSRSFVPVLQLASGSWGIAAMIAWFSGMAWLLFRLMKGCRYLFRLKRSSRPLDAQRQEEIDGWMLSMRLPRRITVGTSNRIGTPVAIGFFRPAILLPEGFLADISDTELRQIIWHEVAHLRRWDDWTNLLQEVVLAFCCFNPIAWWLESRIRLEREVACDDSVLREAGEPKAYARCLTHLAEMSQLSDNRMAPGLMMVRSQLARRISLLLDRKRNISTRPCAWQLALGLTTAAVIVLMSARSPLLISVATAVTPTPTSPSGSAPIETRLDAGGHGAGVTGVDGQELQDPERGLNSASAARIKLEEELQQLRSIGQNISSLVALPTIAKDSLVTNSLAKIGQLEVTIGELKKRYQPRHPKYHSTVTELSAWQERFTNAVLEAAQNLTATYANAIQAEAPFQSIINAAAQKTQSPPRSQATSQTAHDPRSEKVQLLLQELSLVEEQLAIEETRLKQAPRGQGADIRTRIFDLRRDLLSLKRTLLDLGMTANGPSNTGLEQRGQAAEVVSGERKREQAEASRQAEAVKLEMLKSFLEIAKSDAYADVRLSAVDAIGRLGTDAAIEPLGEIVMTDANETVRLRAVAALGRGNAASLDAALRLFDRLDKSDLKLKWAVIDQFAQNKLIPRVSYSSDTGTMATNHVALRQVATEAVPKLTQIARGDPLREIRNLAIQKIGSLPGHETTGVLISLYDDCQDTECKTAIIELLGQRPSPEAADKLLAIARSDPEPVSRQAAVKNLSALSSNSGSYSNLVAPRSINQPRKDGSGGGIPKPEAKLEKRFSVLGQVKHPGRFTTAVDDPLTLLEAVAMAGGWTPQANPRRVTVLRTRDGKQERFNGLNVDPRATGGTNLFEINDQDVISVPEKIF